MDNRCENDRYIKTHMKSRERGYIWLEKECKRMITASSAAVALFFVIIFLMFQPGIVPWAVLFCAAMLLNAAWEYLTYRREYRSYQAFYRYLEEFETGNYAYRGEKDFIDEGICAQLGEQLARMGAAFGGLKERLVEEKENTLNYYKTFKKKVSFVCVSMVKLMNYQMILQLTERKSTILI